MTIIMQKADNTGVFEYLVHIAICPDILLSPEILAAINKALISFIADEAAGKCPPPRLSNFSVLFALPTARLSRNIFCLLCFSRLFSKHA